MQTFLPYSDFKKSAKSLDYRRLGKQRVECYQILRANLGITSGWINHPITKMWKGFEYCLLQYTLAICDEWIGKGYKDTIKQKVLDLGIKKSNKKPRFLGNKYFYENYQKILLEKNYNYYSNIFKI